MESPDLWAVYRLGRLLVAAFVFLTGCSTESLQIQTGFPFTVTTQRLPVSIRVGTNTSFDVMIISERTTSTTAYTARWHNLSVAPARLMLNGKVLTDNQPVSIPIKGSTAVFVPLDTAGTSYQFELSIVDQAGVTQTLPLSLQTVR